MSYNKTETWQINKHREHAYMTKTCYMTLGNVTHKTYTFSYGWINWIWIQEGFTFSRMT